MDVFAKHLSSPRMGKMGLLAIYCRTSKGDETTTDRQIADGIKFANENGFEFHVYDEPGKTGYLIEDETNPFKDRPAMTKLLRDVKEGLVDKIWVWEHSRLARKDIAGAHIFNTFEKHSVIIYEKGKPYDMNDPQTRMIMNVLNSIAEYERHLIQSRTTDGLHRAINVHGRKTSPVAFGYSTKGKDEKNKNHRIWEPVEHELEQVKFAFDKFLSGGAVRDIVSNVTMNEAMTLVQRITMEKKWRRILSNDIYTGHILNMEGRKIFKSYRKHGGVDINELRDTKYWVKSPCFTKNIITIDEWIQSIIISQVPKTKYITAIRRTGTAMGTGVMQCPQCDLKFFLFRKGEKLFYRHYGNRECKQRPKQFALNGIDDIFNLFYFSYFVLFDDTRDIIAQSQRAIKMEQATVRNQLRELEKENERHERRIEKINQIIYDDNDDLDVDTIKEVVKDRKEWTSKLEANVEIMKGMKATLGELDSRYRADAVDLAFYDIFSKIVSFMETMTVDEKKIALGNVIKRCDVYGNHIIINTGRVIFLFMFDKKDGLKIPPEVWAEFKSDYNRFKENFMNSANHDGEKGEDRDNRLETYYRARRLGDINIFDDSLLGVESDLFEDLGIEYDTAGVQRFVRFTRDAPQRCV